MKWFTVLKGDYVPSEDALQLIPARWNELTPRRRCPVPKVDGEVWLVSSKERKALPDRILNQLEQKLASQFYYLRTFKRVMKGVNRNWLKKNFPSLGYMIIWDSFLKESFFQDRLERAFTNLYDFGYYDGYMLLRYDGKSRKWYGAKLVSNSLETIIDSVYASAALLPERTAFRQRIAIGKVPPRPKEQEPEVVDKCSSDIHFSISSQREEPIVRYRFADGVRPEYEDKLEECIHYLLMHDYPIALIEAMIDRNIRISDIEVNGYYEIFLPKYYRDDWNGVVEMEPLPKTILIFFLRHPDKRFQHYQLKDYEAEFYAIYNWITNTGSDHEDTIRNRIHTLVTNNKYFSMLVNDIKQAFQAHLDDRITERYYVKKNKSGYGIMLSPDLIHCP